MKRIIFLLVVTVILVLSFLFSSRSVDAHPFLQTTVTPTFISYLPIITNNCSTSEVCYRLYGLNFSPYIDDDEDPTKGGNQITDAELYERIKNVAPNTQWIRTFGCNEDLKEAGMYAHQMKLKVAVGAWLGREPGAEQENRNQINCLKERAKEGYVDMAVVGSEVLLRGDLSEDKLLGYINELKQYFQQEGINVPVTYADIYGVLLDHPNVISASDVIFPNYYPYWEGRSIDYAVAYVHQWHKQLIAVAGDKEVIVSETGWPSCGEQIGEAVASPQNASLYFLNFTSWAQANNVKYFYFETFDEKWKAKTEGGQGACWGIWDSGMNLKTGMQDVFDCKTMADNWSRPIPETPIIDFFALPELTQTNLKTFVVASSTEPNDEVWLKGAQLPSDVMDESGNFVTTVPLVVGDNLLDLVIKSGDEVTKATQKTIHYDPAFSTSGKRLIYVDSVAVGEDVPAISGTIVIDLDGDTLLGLIEDKHIVGISPNGSEVYTSDRIVINTNTHQEMRALPFTKIIAGNSFITSPYGNRLYSRDGRLDVSANVLLDNLPIDIATGIYSWGGAATPGGPAISIDGRNIYSIGTNVIKIVDTGNNVVTETGITITNEYVGDIAITPDENKILLSDYSYGQGRLRVYDAKTFSPLALVSGLGDFSGEVEFSKDGQRAIVGSAGNPQNAVNGGITVIDLNKLQQISRTTVPLADNLATSGNDEFFVSSGENSLFSRLGVDVYVLEPSGNLVRMKSFYLGINGFIQSTGNPKFDQIHKIVFKPAINPM